MIQIQIPVTPLEFRLTDQKVWVS